MLKKFIKETGFGISILLITAIASMALTILPIFGNVALIVKSGSMSPIINVGDLILVKDAQKIASPQTMPAANYKVGDIIAFHDTKNPSIIVTHRISQVVNQDNKIFYKTKGDANNVEDQNLVAQESIVGKGQVAISKLGEVFAFAKSRNGFPVLVIFPCLFVIISELLNIGKEINSERKVSIYYYLKKTGKKFNFQPPKPSFKILLPVIASLLLIKFTYAFFANSATSTSNIFAASTSFPSPTLSPSPSPSPSQGPQAGDVVINELNWAGSTKGSSDEWIELRNTSSNTIDISNWQITKWVTSSVDHEDLMLTIPSGKTITAGSVFLIAAKSPGVGTELTASPDVIDSSVVLSNTALQVKLYVNNWDSGGLLIDKAGDKGAPLAGLHDGSGNPKKFYSMERNSSPSDGAVAGNWHTATTSVNIDSDNNQNKATPEATND